MLSVRHTFCEKHIYGLPRNGYVFRIFLARTPCPILSFNFSWNIVMIEAVINRVHFPGDLAPKVQIKCFRHYYLNNHWIYHVLEVPRFPKSTHFRLKTVKRPSNLQFCKHIFLPLLNLKITVQPINREKEKE